MSNFKKIVALTACMLIAGGIATGCNSDDNNKISDTEYVEDEETESDNKTEGVFSNLGRITSVSIDDGRRAVVTEDGDLYVWGSNRSGILGIGKTEEEVSSVDTPVKILENVQYVTLDCNLGAAITKDGKLYTWGANLYGQLGTGDYETSISPIHILNHIIQVDIGRCSMAAVSDNGWLYTWGLNDNGMLGTGMNSFDLQYSAEPLAIMENVINVDLGDEHGAAITSSNELYVWGANSHGNFGNGTQLTCDRASHEFPTPAKVLDNVVDASCGSGVTAAVTSDGSLYTCGLNTHGELGIGKEDKEPHYEFVKVLENVKSVSFGKTSNQSHSCFAVTNNGALYSWGKNYGGKLGNDTMDSCFTPTKIMDGINYAEGGNHAAGAIGEDGSFYMWGNIYSESYTVGSEEDVIVLEPLKMN